MKIDDSIFYILNQIDNDLDNKFINIIINNIDIQLQFEINLTVLFYSNRLIEFHDLISDELKK
jgi:hypothetical protein